MVTLRPSSAGFERYPEDGSGTAYLADNTTLDTATLPIRSTATIE